MSCCATLNHRRLPDAAVQEARERVRSTERSQSRSGCRAVRTTGTSVGNWPLASKEMAAALEYAGSEVRCEFGIGSRSIRHRRRDVRRGALGGCGESSGSLQNQHEVGCARAAESSLAAQVR